MQSRASRRSLPKNQGMHPPTCRQLLLSWLLGAAAVLAMQEFGHAGVFATMLLIPVWERIRGAHDRHIADQLFRSRGAAPVLTAIYYLCVFIGAMHLVSHGERLEALPFGELLVVLMLPVLLAMVAADHAVCRASEGGGPRDG